MKKKVRIVIFIIIILLFFIVINKNIKKQENGNLANMGLVVQDGDNIYYNKYEKGIFAIKNGVEKQITDETAYSLNIANGQIYYMTVADFNNVMIKKVDTNGENKKTVATIYTSVSKICIEGKNIYYLTNKGNGGIAKMDLNGENESLIVEDDIKDFQVVKNDVFYINSANQICKIKTSGESNQILKDDVIASRLQIVDKWIYYLNNTENALFRLSKNGNKNELISVLVKNEMYNVSGKYVYYLDSENLKIARMQIGKTNKCDDIVNMNISKTKINIVNDEIYYLDKSVDDSQTYQMFRIKQNGKSAKSIEY